MSEREKTLKTVADWASKEQSDKVQDGIVILNKFNLDKESLNSFENLYPSFNNIQFIRFSTAKPIGKRDGVAKLVALNTDSTCTVAGGTTSLGEEFTVQAGKSIPVTPAGEFAFLER